MQDASQRGQQIPEQALAEHIVNQFEEAMKAIEQAVRIVLNLLFPL